MGEEERGHVERLSGRIRAVHPDLEVTSFRYERGQFNDVLLLDGGLVFRFPRSPHAAQVLAHEVSILRAIRPYLSLPIPNPEFGDLASSEPFVGYRLIPGAPLTRADVAAMDDAGLDRLAGQLAGFLTVLHAVPLDRLGAESPRDTRDEWLARYAEMRERLFPFMRDNAREAVRRHFEPYLDDPDSFAFEPRVRHGDFGAGNILWDAATATVTGVIDFSFAGVGDPAIDAAAASTLHPSMLERLIDHYPALASMRRRVSFYRGTYALQEALDGLRDGDAEAFERGIQSYR